MNSFSKWFIISSFRALNYDIYHLTHETIKRPRHTKDHWKSILLRSPSVLTLSKNLKFKFQCELAGWSPSFRLLQRVYGARTAQQPSEAMGISFISVGQLSDQFSLLQIQPLLESIHESTQWFSLPAKDPANHIITSPHPFFQQNLHIESQRYCEFKKNLWPSPPLASF